jgi:Ca2+/Na+ antiporter
MVRPLVFIPLTGLTLPHLYVCPKLGLGFLLLFVVSILRSLRFDKGVVRIVVVGYIVYHYYLIVPF